VGSFGTSGDTFTKIDQTWHFAERKLILDWSETRSMTDH